jgi:hypothetical protein
MNHHSIEGVTRPHHYNDENEIMVHPMGEFTFLTRERYEGATRYSVALRSNSAKLRKVVYLNVRGRHADVEAQLDMVEESILRNALFSKTGAACTVRYVEPLI